MPKTPRRSTNLPTPVSPFIGQRTEIAAIAQTLKQHRLVTLTGAGGCGKTRLSVEVGNESRDHYPDGVWFVELATVTDDDGVARAVANVFGWREEVGKPVTDMLVRELSNRHALVILDNCEHLLDACAGLANQLLRAAPELRIVATSRELLGIDGEFTWRVPSMDTATGCKLFDARSQLVRPVPSRSTADSHNANVIAKLVERLDGLPLAIELAAARTRVMQPQHILESLDDRFRLLTGGSRQRVPRQQTLEASVSWSYDLLEGNEQLLARRLSILHRFDLATAEAVGTGEHIDTYAVLDLLTRLVEKSLVVADHTAEQTSYRFMETIRLFLLNRLQHTNEALAVRQRHLTYFMQLAERLAPELALEFGPVHIAELHANSSNIDDALSWAESSDSVAEMLRLTTALSLYYELGGQLAHGTRWFRRALALAEPIPSDTQDFLTLHARAHWGAAHVAFYSGQYESSAVLATNALALAERAKDSWAEARALNTLGVLQSLSAPIDARESLSRSIELGRQNGDSWAVADGLKMTTVSWYVEHDGVAVLPTLQELHDIGTTLRARFFLAWQQAMVGYFARDYGQFARAQSAYDAAAAASLAVGDPSTGGFVECWSAALDIDMGQFDRAQQRLEHLLATAATSGSELALPETLYILGNLYCAQGNYDAAVALVRPHLEPMLHAGVPSWAAQLQLTYANAERNLGHVAQSIAALDQAESLAAPLNNAFLNALIAYERAQTAMVELDVVRAEDQLHVALRAQVEGEYQPGAIRTLEALGHIAVQEERAADATRILGAMHGARTQIGLALTPIERSALDRVRLQLREWRGADDFDAQWNVATSLPLSDIVEAVSRSRGQRNRPSSGWASLTPTELRVASLVAEGLTNPQIGERMFIARGTVKAHVAHIFTKLSVTSRAQLAAMAVTKPNTV